MRSSPGDAITRTPAPPPYTPWVQVGNTVGQAVGVGTDPAALQGLGADFSHLVRLFPVLRQMIPNFVEPDVISDPDAAQYQLFEAYTQFIAGASQSAPLMLVLDDLHWTDKPSLLLLQHLARQLASMRVLVIGTFRDTDLVRTHPLSETLATLNREGGFERVTLRALSREECVTYIRSSARVEPSPSVLARIVEETEGNPFFLSEVVNLMAQEGTLDATSLSDITIPDGVREALGRRLDRLSDGANALLQVAAVVGREFPYDTLSLVSEHDGDTLLGLIEESVDARVIEELDRPGRYRFTHHLMQETLLAELSTTRRIRVHGRIGEALEERYGARADERASALAQHFVEAALLGDVYEEKALRYSRAAAAAAERASAWATSERYLSACVSLLENRDDVEPAVFASLITELARVRRIVGSPGAVATLEAAIEAARRVDDDLAFARTVVEVVTDWTYTADEFRLRVTEEALTRLRDQDEHLRARLLVHRSQSGWDTASDQAAAEALRLGQANGWPEIEGYALRRESQAAFGRLAFHD